MTSLQGYVTATYSELTEALGYPTFDGPSADGKVDTEWELFDEEVGQVTVYDWKCYGHVARDGEPYRWHIGGTNRWAVEFVSNLLNRDATYV
tara:strand:+ start:350 stop:625 length:276 start_codon:yes stop_codon:yes gene_type:complete